MTLRQVPNLFVPPLTLNKVRTIITPPSRGVGIKVLIQANGFRCLVTISRCCVFGLVVISPSWLQLNWVNCLLQSPVHVVSSGWRPEWLLYFFNLSSPWLLSSFESYIFFISVRGGRGLRHIFPIYCKKTKQTNKHHYECLFFPLNSILPVPSLSSFFHFLIWDDPHLVPLGFQLTS